MEPNPQIILIINILGMLLKNYTPIKNRVLPYITFGAALLGQLALASGPVDPIDPPVSPVVSMAFIGGLSWAWLEPMYGAAINTACAWATHKAAKVTGIRNLFYKTPYGSESPARKR